MQLSYWGMYRICSQRRAVTCDLGGGRSILLSYGCVFIYCSRKCGPCQ